MIAKPDPSLYDPFYHNYIESVPNGDILEILKNQKNDNLDFYSSISEEKSTFKYQEGKWSIKELIGHLNDAERIFAYRALSFARKEKAELPGFEEDDYVDQSYFSERSWQSIIKEHEVVRDSSISLFENFSERVWTQIGNANGSQMVLSAIPFIIYGHEEHHKRIIKERYLK